jgi:peptidyl-prolyl cis-trans isomerase SurA
MTSIPEGFQKFLAISLLVLSINMESNADQDDIVAYVNNEIITSYDLKNRVALTEAINKTKISNVAKKAMLQSLIDEKLLDQIAKRNGISISEQQIHFSTKEMAKANGFGDLDQLVRHYNINKKEFLKQIEAQLLLKKLIERQIEPETKVSNEEVLDNLNAISRNLNQPASVALDMNGDVKISEIVLYKEQMSQKDMLQTVTNIYSQLQKGASFESLAKQFSQSNSASSGGLIGWMKLSQLSAPIATAIGGELGTFKTGRVVNHPIELEDRIILIKLVDTKQKKPVPQPLKEQEVKDILYNQKINSSLRNFLNNLRKTAYIRIKD